jgi:hypothetical protein
MEGDKKGKAIMTYEGPLYGKLGRRYIPLRLTSLDVDRMEKELEFKNREIEHLHEIIFKLNQSQPFVIPGPLIVKKELGKLANLPGSHFNPMSEPISSFKFDNPTTHQP